jgi:AraC-like DNA-binding protein
MEDLSKSLALSLLAYSAQRDLSADRLCRLSHIDPESLQPGSNQPLSEKQVSDLWLNAVLLSGDELFGLHFGESLQLAALGVVGQLIKSSRTIGEALMIAASLTPMITPLFKIDVARTEGLFTVCFLPQGVDLAKNPAAAQVHDFLMVFVIHELDGLVMKKIKPVSVRYAGVSKNINELERVLRCRPQVTDNKSMISFDAGYWDNPIITANYDLQQFLFKKNSALQMNVNASASLKDRIFHYLMSNAYLGIVSIDQVALNFNISTRTLQRKLKEEGISFQQVADEVRKSLALEYLHTGAYQLKEISYMLGYNEISAFSRTFKRWTGYSPAFYSKKYS